MYDYPAQPIYNPMIPPYMQIPQQQQQPAPQQMPRQEVVKVNGEQGALAYQMGPNSGVLLLDVSGTMIWAVATDGAGYKTAKPFDITPHVDAPPPDFAGLDARLTKLEEMIYHAAAPDPATARRDSKPADRPERPARGDQAGHH